MSTTTLAFHQTTIGKKAIMAVTGVVMLGFVFFHMIGNLQIFSAPTVVAGKSIYALDTYAALLRTVPAALWVARLVLLASVAAHIWAAVSLIALNKSARPTPYQGPKREVATSYAAMTMRYGGPMITLFIIYHVLHFTLGAVGGGYDVTSVHKTVIAGFSNPLITGVYVFANLLLGLHLFHGTWSFLQTLGLSHPRYNHLRTLAATGFAGVVAGGNIIIAVSVLAGLAK